MRRLFTLLTFAIFAVSLNFTSCSSQQKCPTSGNFGARNHSRVKHKSCAGTNSTGNYKPKLKRKKEDGLFSKKMQ